MLKGCVPFRRPRDIHLKVGFVVVLPSSRHPRDTEARARSQMKGLGFRVLGLWPGLGIVYWSTERLPHAFHPRTQLCSVPCGSGCTNREVGCLFRLRGLGDLELTGARVLDIRFRGFRVQRSTFSCKLLLAVTLYCKAPDGSDGICFI